MQIGTFASDDHPISRLSINLSIVLNGSNKTHIKRKSHVSTLSYAFITSRIAHTHILYTRINTIFFLLFTRYNGHLHYDKIMAARVNRLTSRDERDAAELISPLGKRVVSGFHVDFSPFRIRMYTRGKRAIVRKRVHYCILFVQCIYIAVLIIRPVRMNPSGASTGRELV